MGTKKAPRSSQANGQIYLCAQAHHERAKNNNVGDLIIWHRVGTPT